VNTEGLLEQLNIVTQGKEINVLFRNIMTELNTMEERPNLLVIDNANPSFNPLYDYLPAPPQWHILVTFCHQLPRFETKELDFLSEDEAIELFLTEITMKSINAFLEKTLGYILKAAAQSQIVETAKEELLNRF